MADGFPDYSDIWAQQNQNEEKQLPPHLQTQPDWQPLATRRPSLLDLPVPASASVAAAPVQIRLIDTMVCKRMRYPGVKFV